MENTYWIGRQSSATARKANTAEARLIHAELAAPYAAQAGLSVPAALPATGVVRPLLHLRHGGSNRPAPFDAPLHEWRFSPAADAGLTGGRRVRAESRS